MDTARSPYEQLWALFGGRIENSDGSVNDSLNSELKARWNFAVTITEKLWWDEETKTDHDGEEKRFIYLDVICTIESGDPDPTNKNEILEWVAIDGLKDYDINPPTRVLLRRLGYLD